MRNTATWRSMGGRASERKSGWCRAMCARRSTCTTKSGTAAVADWREAGRSRPVGRSASMDLVTFGEAMVRLTPPAFQRIEQTTSFDIHVGGSELNVAVLTARLGVKSRWVSRLPDNALGRLIGARAQEQGVDAHVEWTADA